MYVIAATYKMTGVVFGLLEGHFRLLVGLESKLERLNGFGLLEEGQWINWTNVEYGIVGRRILENYRDGLWM